MTGKKGCHLDRGAISRLNSLSLIGTFPVVIGSSIMDRQRLAFSRVVRETGPGVVLL